jgi:hypothetical protein
VPKIDAVCLCFLVLCWVVLPCVLGWGCLVCGLDRVPLFVLWGACSVGVPGSAVAVVWWWWGWGFDIDGEFDPGSGRTLAACLTHASRTVISGLAPGDQWRTGE